MPEDSPLRNPEQIPYPAPPPPVQSQAGAIDEEDTPSMKELVREIDTHAETVDLEATSNLNAVEDAQIQKPPIEDAPRIYIYIYLFIYIYIYLFPYLRGGKKN